MLPFPCSFKVVARSKVQDTVVVVIEAIASSFSYCSPHESLALTSLTAISPPPAPVPLSGAAATSLPAAPAAFPLHSLSHLSVADVALIVRPPPLPHVLCHARYTAVAGVVQGRSV